MRGSKAKRLRKAGVKSGPAERPEPTEDQILASEKRQMRVRALVHFARQHEGSSEAAKAKRARRAERNLRNAAAQVLSGSQEAPVCGVGSV